MAEAVNKKIKKKYGAIMISFFKNNYRRKSGGEVVIALLKSKVFISKWVSSYIQLN